MGTAATTRAPAAAALLILALIAAALVADSSRAQAPTSVTVEEAVERSCFEGLVGDAAGAAALEVPDPGVPGVVEARLDAPEGSDWDVAVFDAEGDVVAASASAGPTELASGYVLDEGGLIVQACRVSGEGSEASLAVTTEGIDAGEAPRSSLAMVDVSSPAEQAQLDALSLDSTEHGHDGAIAVVLHGPADRDALERAGLDYEIEVGDLGRQSARDRAADAEFAAETRRSALPSGSDTYRRLFEYSQELKDLAERNPEIVRPITLPHETYEGRVVEGVEITTNPDNIRDGKPVFLQMGIHHAREWPSGEHALEWAYELIEGYRKGNVRVTRLLRQTRTIVIPVVNPDGFNASREAGQAQGSGNGENGSFLTTFPLSPNEYRRKNCRFPAGEGGSCAQPAFGIASGGVDPNRNYGAFWGGPGSSPDPTQEDHHGPAPFSEPESQNIRELVSSRQVTTLITNHTFSNLVLRPPGQASQPDPVDEPVYKALGDSMAAENGYLSQKGYELYDTSGTTEDWSYNATGGLGFTFEIYCDHIPDLIDDRCGGNFHPTYDNVVEEYEGTSPDAQAVGGGGNREAYFVALESTADPEMHSVIEGKAPPGAILRLEKTFDMPTSVENPASFEDHLETEMRVPASGEFDYHVNPSTRPLVAQSQGRQAQGPPSPSESFSGSASATNAPCAANQSTDPDCFDDHPFTVPGGPGVDNDSATVRIDWTTPASDWDLYVYTDSDGDGTSLRPDGPDAGTEPDVEPNLVASSATGPTDSGNSETATFLRPEGADGRLEPGDFVARVENYAALEPYEGEITFEGPPEFVPARQETWKLTCLFAGESRVTREVLIDRGERKSMDLSACGTRSQPGGNEDRCQSRKPTLVGSRGADRIIGTKGRDVIVPLGGRDVVRGGGGKDVVCGRGGRDRIDGGGGKDRIKGGADGDRIKGAGERDLIWGGGGGDRLAGNGGRDRLRGGRGRDRCAVRGRDRASGCER